VWLGATECFDVHWSDLALTLPGEGETHDLPHEVGVIQMFLDLQTKEHKRSKSTVFSRKSPILEPSPAMALGQMQTSALSKSLMEMVTVVLYYCVVKLDCIGFNFMLISFRIFSLEVFFVTAKIPFSNLSRLINQSKCSYA